MPPPLLTTSFDAALEAGFEDEQLPRGRDDEDEQSDVLSPFQRANPLPGTLDLQLNGKQRSSIIEYIQRGGRGQAWTSTQRPAHTRVEEGERTVTMTTRTTRRRAGE